MSRFISGYQVTELLGIAPFELVELVQKGSIQPYNDFGKKICDIKIKIEQEKPFNEAKRLASLYIRIISLEDNKKKLASNTVGLKSYFFTDRDKFETIIDKTRAEIKDLEQRGVTLESYKQGKPPFPKEWDGCVWEKFDLPLDEEEAKRLVQKFLNFSYPKSDVENLKKTIAGTILNEGNLAKEYLHIDSDTDTSTPEDEIENIVRNLVFAYEDNEQISIKAPKMPKKLFTANSLGFKNSRVKTWKQLILILKNPEHTYNVGEAGEKNNINREYSRKLALMKDMCSKVSNFIAKEFSLSLPEGFKLYERVKGETPGTYAFKFRIRDDNDTIVDNFDPVLDKMSNEELIKKIATLKTQSDLMTDSKSDEQNSEILNHLSDLYFYASTVRKIPSEEINKILDEPSL